MSTHEPLSAEEMARKAAGMAGGTWAAPHEEFHLTARDEVIVETPLAQPDQYEVRFFHPDDVLDMTRSIAGRELDPSSLVRIVCYERREYRHNVWVPEREEYDAANNVLNLYGHWRIHRFFVWVPEGSAAP